MQMSNATNSSDSNTIIHTCNSEGAIINQDINEADNNNKNNNSSNNNESDSNYNNNSSSDKSVNADEVVTLADYERLVAEGRKLVARVQSVAKKQQIWKSELEQFYVNEEIQRIRAAALTEMVHEHELESIDNAEFREWFASSNARFVLSNIDYNKYNNINDVNDNDDKDYHNNNIEDNISSSNKSNNVIKDKDNITDSVHENYWFHSERLSLLTPFAAMIPFPAQLSTQGSVLVQESIDKLPFHPCYVQTISARANLWDVAEQFVCTSNTENTAINTTAISDNDDDNNYVSCNCNDNINIKQADSNTTREKEHSVLSYLHMPCHKGSDVVTLISQNKILSNTLQHTPCLFINNTLSCSSLCGRCLVIRNQCVAAEVLLSSTFEDFIMNNCNSYNNNNTHQINNFVEVSDKDNRNVENTKGEFSNNVNTATSNSMRIELQNTIAFALQSFVKEKVQSYMTSRTFMLLFVAHINKSNNENMECLNIEAISASKEEEPRETDKLPHNHATTTTTISNEHKLDEREHKLEEKDIHFEVLNIDHADTTAFTLFTIDELCTAAGYVLRRNTQEHTTVIDNNSHTKCNRVQIVLMPPIIRVAFANKSICTTNKRGAVTSTAMPNQITPVIEKMHSTKDKEIEKFDSIALCIRHAEKAQLQRIEQLGEDTKKLLEENEEQEYKEGELQSTVNVGQAKVKETVATTIVSTKATKAQKTQQSELDNKKEEITEHAVESISECKDSLEVNLTKIKDEDNLSNKRNLSSRGWWTRAHRTAIAMVTALKMRLISAPEKYM